MDELDLTTFARIIGGRLVGTRSCASARVADVSVHSGRLRRATAFFALEGGRSSGATYAAAALAGGAVVAVVAEHRPEAAGLAAGPLVAVADPLDALQRLAAWWRGRLRCPVVAVVGANGKTTTKDALVHFAAGERYVYGSPGSYNSQMGVALSVLGCPEEADLAIIEAASVEVGAMHRLQRMVRPDAVVVTNLGHRNESLFPSRRARAADMMAMAADLAPQAVLVCGERDPALEAQVAERGLSATWVVDGDAGWSLHEDLSGRMSQVAQIALPGGGRPTLEVGHPSRAIAHDVHLALVAARLLDPGAQASDRRLRYSPTAIETTVWQSPEGVTVVREAPTADPIALTASLRTARNLIQASGRLFVALADPWEGAGAQVGEVADALRDAAPARVVAVDAPAHRAVAAALADGGTGGDVAGAVVPAPAVATTLLAPPLHLHRVLGDELRFGDVLVVQAPVDATAGDPVELLVDALASRRLHVNLSAVESNVAAFRRLLGPDVALLGVVKALAYGTSSLYISSFLAQAGVDSLAVSSTDEGVVLRRGGVGLPILVLLGTGGELDKMRRHGLTPVLYSCEMLRHALRAADPTDPLEVHLEVDSGMCRTGIGIADIDQALYDLRGNPGLRLAGLMTHLASADEPDQDDVTTAQLDLFDGVVERARALGFRDFVRHAAATAGTLRFPRARYDMVRLGLGLYGTHTSEACRPALALDPAVTFVSRIVHASRLEPGFRVGYGGTFVVDGEGTRRGIVPIGYHDGVFRSLRGGTVLVDGVECPIIGAISMDSMAIDITHVPAAGVGSDVVLFGPWGGADVPLPHYAEMMGTIPHEVLATVGPRVQRIFTRH